MGSEIKKSCFFIRTNNQIGSIFVPPGNFGFRGLERHEWLKTYFGKECAVASTSLWLQLYQRHTIMKLIEEDGEYREESVDGQED